MDVFLTSPWLPPEWIRAHGLTPRGLWAAENFPGHGAPLTAGVCAFAAAAIRFAQTRTDAAVIFSTECDQLRRGCDLAGLTGQPRALLFNLPATWQTAAAKNIFRAELERLGHFLLSLGGRPPTSERLRQAMAQSAAARTRLLAAAPTANPRAFANAVALFHQTGTAPTLRSATPTRHLPLALVGGPLLATHEKLLAEIESAGGCVALNATQNGERSLCPAFQFESPDHPGVTRHPFDALIDGYCDHLVEAFQRPNTRLYAWLKPRLAARQVRGIMLWHYPGCDLWRAELPTLRETFGLPVLLLEASHEPGISSREQTRLQAFLETLERTAVSPA